MKIGLFTALFAKLSLDDVLKKIKPLGIRTVELGTGNYPGDPHLKLEWLSAPAKLKEFKQKLDDQGVSISALSCHGNPLHPNKRFAETSQETSRKTILLAEKLSVTRVIDFSGCPGDSDGAKFPNWVTTPWPPDYPEILKWQWEKKVIPYWKKRAKFAEDHGVRIAIEMHPGFVAYSPETMLRLRAEAGPAVGCNFDPSHMFWQGIDPCIAVRALGEAVFHVHAKDTRIYDVNSRVNGVLDNKPYSDEKNRSFIFRTVGYGHGTEFWTDLVSTLQMVGYDDVLSIEHEDSLMSIDEGVAKAAAFLNQVIIKEKLKEMWWA
ncbi:MAG: sugar phosphate isomerase/epimerase [Acidobacteriota bacterium]|nr:sugar phosphate isomerase/epimerase [Acidobacteriota bacterium]